MRVGLQKRLSVEEMMLLNYGAEQDSRESLGLQGNQTSPHKGNQPRLFIRRTGAEAPLLCNPNAESWRIQKDSDAGKDRRQKAKGA